MKITIPTTSTKLVDILTPSQITTIRKQRNDIHHPVLIIEAKGKIWWTVTDDEAVVGESISIKPEHTGVISIENGLQEINHLKFIAESSTTANIEVVSALFYTQKNGATEEKQDDQITALNTIANNTTEIEWRYKGVNKTADADYKYFGFKEKGGERWYIMRFTIADKSEVLYAEGDDNFDTAWDNPSLLTYS